MATPRKPAKAAETPATVATFPYSLESVIQATKEDGFVYTAKAFHDPLIVSGDVIINPMIENDKGEIATRATEKHLNKTESTNTVTEQNATVTAEKPKFLIEADVPMPTVVRKSSGLRAGRTPVYPFDGLEIGQSFFVPNASADKPAAKAMASTVAGANVRFSEEVAGEVRTNRKGKTVPVTVQLRKFKIFDTERTLEDGTVQKGARVFRIALNAE